MYLWYYILSIVIMYLNLDSIEIRGIMLNLNIIQQEGGN
jgi:hypothetical protein